MDGRTSGTSPRRHTNSEQQAIQKGKDGAPALEASLSPPFVSTDVTADVFRFPNPLRFQQ